SYLKHEFPDVFVLEEKVVIQHLLAFAHLFIGGGGTINTEACFFGTPTISTRSFICHYDKYQIDSGLMHWVSGSEDLMKTASSIFGKRTDRLAASVFSEMNVNTKQIVDGILDQQ
ncbi:MAG: DUF354 domain-containing protein, partial [Spirochaetia bacterium]|nr:DUF354 domain-containing protein [Spirochaetia bacterium]